MWRLGRGKVVAGSQEGRINKYARSRFNCFARSYFVPGPGVPCSLCHGVYSTGGLPVWVVESNASEGSRARAQNNAMAALPGVIGVNGVL